MINNNDQRRLGDVIECRFLNPDGVGVILERLSQPEVVRLFHWFLDEGGGKAGNLLLENAPLFDTTIELQADLPPFACPPATVDSIDEAARTASVTFTDYGNSESVALDDLLLGRVQRRAPEQ